MNTNIRMAFLVLFFTLIIFIGCDKSSTLTIPASEIYDTYIYFYSYMGEAYRKKVGEIEKNIYYTYRTGMLESTWNEMSKTLPIWTYLQGKKIPLWLDDLRPENEVELATHIPWLISDYKTDLNEIKIIIPKLKAIKGPIGKQEVSNPKEEDAYGDVSPTAFITQGNLETVGIWESRPNVLTININEKNSDNLLNKLKSNIDFKVKVYYKIKAAICYVVKVEIFTKSDELILETKLDTTIPIEINRWIEEISH